MNVPSHPSAAGPRAAARRRGRRAAGAFAVVAVLCAAALIAGCGGVQVKAEDHVPPPLVDELPLKAGIYYSPEFRTYVHREERWGTKWEVQLGAAHVTKLNRLLNAMFPRFAEVADLGKPPQPPLDLIIEPRFEEYSFVTPRDAGADYYAVTIKYRMNLYDGEARLIDSLVYTGYGNTPAGGISTEKPLMIATDKAMRDAGAKFATEFADQGTIKRLVAGEKIEPVQPGQTAAPAAGGIDEVTPTPTPAPSAAAAATASGAVPPAAASPPTATPSAPPAPTAAPPMSSPAGELPPSGELPPTATPGPPPGAAPGPGSTAAPAADSPPAPPPSRP